MTYIEPFNYNDFYKSSTTTKKSIKKLKPLKNYNIPGTIKIGKTAPRDDTFFVNYNNFPSPSYYNPSKRSIMPRERDGNNNILYFILFYFIILKFFKKVFVNKNDYMRNKKSVIKKIFYSYDQSIDLPLIKLKNEIDSKIKN